MCYIQVSSKCNMACAHCLYSCSPRRGRHMSFDVFRKAVNVSCEYDSCITIGGGEPTLNPDILEMLGFASFVSAEPIFMVTNGTCSKKLWDDLMRAQKTGKIDVRVSCDLWHDTSKLKPWVINDADRLKLWWGDPSIRQRTLVKAGRAKKNWNRLLEDCRLSGIEVRVEDVECCGFPRISPYGGVWADVPNAGLVGSIDDPKAIGFAFQAISEYENREF